MKQLIISILFLSFILGTPKISDIRASFIDASDSKDAVFLLQDKLKDVRKSSNKTLVAYKGAASTMAAKYNKGIESKKKNFKNGATLIEYAVEQAPNNIEIRFVRLIIQQNTPKFLKYKKNIEEDKTFILEHFSEIKSSQLIDFIGNYIAASELFSEEEKNSLK